MAALTKRGSVYSVVAHHDEILEPATQRMFFMLQYEVTRMVEREQKSRD